MAFVADQPEEKKGSFVPDKSLVEQIPTEQPGFTPEMKAAAAARPTPEKPSDRGKREENHYGYGLADKKTSWRTWGRGQWNRPYHHDRFGH